MKRSILVILALMFLGPLAWAAEWLTDYNQALAAAKAQNRPLLMDFTGSDWCMGCIQLHRKVFSQPEFKAYADRNLVLLKVDFPHRKPLPVEQQMHNEQLANRYGVQVFPTLIILKPDGRKAGEMMGYVPGGPKSFIAELERTIR